MRDNASAQSRENSRTLSPFLRLFHRYSEWCFEFRDRTTSDREGARADVMFSQAKSSRKSCCSSEAVKDKAIIGQTSLARIAASGERTRAATPIFSPFSPACIEREGASKKGRRKEESAQRCVRPFFAAQKRYSRSFYGGGNEQHEMGNGEGREEEIEMQTTVSLSTSEQLNKRLPQSETPKNEEFAVCLPYLKSTKAKNPPSSSSSSSSSRVFVV